MSVLAVIPARGGSKGIPKKNIAPLAGRPLIAYTIEAARAARRIDRCVVSTDDAEIAAVAQQLGAEVIERPAELASDDARTEAALLHAVDAVKAADGFDADIVVTLEPTSPLRTAALIDCCVESVLESDADSALTVIETRECLGTMRDGYFEYLVKNQPRRRQDREPLYKESSTVYVTKTETLRRLGSVCGERPLAIIVDPEEAIDINAPFDLVVAEAAIRFREQHAGARR